MALCWLAMKGIDFSFMKSASFRMLYSIKLADFMIIELFKRLEVIIILIFFHLY